MLTATLQRRFFWVRQLAFPLYVAAGVATLEIFARFQPAYQPEALARVVERIPVGRLGKADEIARGVAFLVDENAGFVTGSTLSINGGQHMY